jgi:hypothetical protein
MEYDPFTFLIQPCHANGDAMDGFWQLCDDGVRIVTVSLDEARNDSSYYFTMRLYSDGIEWTGYAPGKSTDEIKLRVDDNGRLTRKDPATKFKNPSGTGVDQYQILNSDKYLCAQDGIVSSSTSTDNSYFSRVDL